MSLHVYNSLWLIETHNRYRYITYFENRRNLVIDMTVYMNVWILILLSFLNFLASVADRTDNIASFEEHGTQTYTHIHTHTDTLYTNSRCSAIVYRGYVHGIAILKGTTKARQDRISTWFCQFYFAVWSRNRHCDHCDSWIFIDRIYNQVLLVEFSRQLQYWRFIFESFSILSIFRLPDMID